MAILGRELSELTRTELRNLVEKSKANQRLLVALNRILHNKSLKQYKTKRVWLVIRNAHPAWDKSQIAALQHCIDIPINHPFEQIWIVGDLEGQSGIVQLYPS